MPPELLALCIELQRQSSVLSIESVGGAAEFFDQVARVIDAVKHNVSAVQSLTGIQEFAQQVNILVQFREELRKQPRDRLLKRSP